jgi:hypothetical protein
VKRNGEGELETSQIEGGEGGVHFRYRESEPRTATHVGAHCLFVWQVNASVRECEKSCCAATCVEITQRGALTQRPQAA